MCGLACSLLVASVLPACRAFACSFSVASLFIDTVTLHWKRFLYMFFKTKTNNHLF